MNAACLKDARRWGNACTVSPVRVDRTGEAPWMRLEEARTALERGMRALQAYFGRFRLKVEADALIGDILDELDRFGVLKR